MKKLHELTGELEAPGEMVALMNGIQWERNILDYLCAKMGNSQMDGCIVVVFNGDDKPEITGFGSNDRMQSLWVAEMIKQWALDEDE